ncbi:hypothetical protein NQ314_013573 [Rhamnusium bicolor]|uniref:Coiled-coil-helix-coiled-coil-helix domain-containing protein 7 n=1 Tax=Rhamnusium bicolor TaxID=1586634 RepID=A0AAV8X5Y2_9CUCU|nr:hypothetical protein NQ314_013573 [Rhamnusium bicolor]
MKNKDAEKNNPCLKEQELSYKCFNDNNFDKEACQLEIQNYQTCKTFWHSVKAHRRKNGLYPTLPPVEEREQVKREFFSKFSM